MELIVGFITHTLWVWIIGIVMQFWQWIVAGAVAVLGFLWSPTIRKYTLGVVAILAIGVAIYLYGYNANHTVQIVTHTCDEFRHWLVSGPATDKALSIFKRHGLCQ